MRRDEFDIVDKHVRKEINSVLDKISAEISEVNEELDGYDPDSLSTLFCRTLEIVEKYKGVSE